MKGRTVDVKIGKLAELAGCQVVTIRYYEKEGLLAKPARSGAGYRLYAADDVERLKFIRHCRSHGMTLNEIKALLKMRETPDRDCSEVNELVDRHIAEIEDQIQSLKRLKDHLVQLRKKCPHGGIMSACGIMRGLNDQLECSCFSIESAPQKSPD